MPGPYVECVRTNRLSMIYSSPFLNFPSESRELSFEFEFDLIGIDSLLRKKLIKVDIDGIWCYQINPLFLHFLIFFLAFRPAGVL